MLKESLTSSFKTDEELSYRVGKEQCHKAFSALAYWIHDRLFSRHLFEIDPLLWADVWVTLAKTALFESIDERNHNQLTMSSMTQRYADQEKLCLSFTTTFEVLNEFSHHLFFPSHANAEAYPANCNLRDLLVSARQLAQLFVPDQIFLPDFPSAQCMALRRAGFANLFNALYSDCLAQCDGERLDVTSNSDVIACMLKFWPMPYEAPLNPPWEESSQVIAPPPPPLPTGMIKLVLRLLTSQQTSLVTASMGFLTRVISVFFLRSRPYDTEWCVPAEVAKSRYSDQLDLDNPSRTPGLVQADTGAFLFNPEDDFLSNDSSFLAHHHLPDATRSLL